MKITKVFQLGVSLIIGCISWNASAQLKSEQPNIVFIVCDDLGYGEVQALAPETSKIKTPSIDQLTREGMVFTDAHSGSAVCTPTRYGIMTGRYSWRTKLQRGVVQGFAPNLIKEDRPTIANFLKNQGYHTALIGKWHLNFQYIDPITKTAISKKSRKDLPPVGATIPDGPVNRGFDYYHGFHHAKDMKAVIENDEVVLYDDEINMLPRLTTKSVEYINKQADNNDRKPFFLYIPLGSPHTPILPSKEWQGKSDMGDYADFVMQTDATVGAITDALKTNGLTENTLIIFTSDNGTSKAADIKGLAEQGHSVSAGYRGSKSDLWDGGHRVPFIVKWPNNVKPNTTSDELICLTDIFATFSEITNVAVPSKAGEDSVSFLPALKGEDIYSTRAGVIHHSITGHFAYRLGKWKLLLAKGSGGWSSPREKEAADMPKAQLYDMENDAAESENLYLKRPEIVEKLLKQLKLDIETGRSTKGEFSKNDVDKIVLWKSERKNANNKKKNKKKSKTFYPKFSWETTPMYYMFGDPKRVLHPEEVDYIAERTDFICIEKSHGEGELGAAELGAKHEVAAFKKVNPDMKVLFYFNSAYAWPFTSYNKNFTHENINDNPELKSFLIENPETKELEERKKVFYFDVLNPDFREWWVNTVVEGVNFTGADGAFIDQMHGFAWLRQDKSQDVQKAMGDMMKALKEKLGPHKILLGNNANAKLARHVFPSIDANMFEHYGNKMLSKEKLLNDWEDMLKISEAGKMSIFRIGVEYDSIAVANPAYYKGRMRNERFATLSKEKLEYYHACYLIGAQPYSYFQYGWGWQLAHGSLMDYPELQKPLGAPKGPFNRISSTDWEFTREFEHATVWVNTETKQAKITWH